MVGKAWAIVAAVLVIFVLVVFPLGPFTAQGAPSTPGIQINTPLNPSVSQTIQVLITTKMYSSQPPNSIDLLGSKIVYSAWAGTVNVAFHQSAAIGILSSSGGFLSTVYTLGTTVTFTLGSSCVTAGCPGATSNFSVSAQAQVSTYFAGTLFSPVANVTFVNNGQAGGTTAADAPTSSYYYQVFGPVTLAAAIVLLLVGIVGPRWLLIPGIGLVLVFFGEAVAWAGLVL